MAEATLLGITSSVLQQLASPALDEFRLLWGAKEQLDKLEDTITMIGDVLQDADRRQATDASVKRWLARLRVALYDADDLFDLISAKVLLNKDASGSKIGRKVRRLILKPYRFAFYVETAHKVKAIRENLDRIAQDRNQFCFLSIQTAHDQPFTIMREQTYSYVSEADVIGRDQEREDLVKMLVHESSEPTRGGVSVIAVIGIGGLGKTTLAQLVYNDKRVQDGFDLCMWTCINYLSDLKQVLRVLLKSDMKGELDQLQSLFRKQIEGKRFLLIVDDLWETDPQNWNKLKSLLDCGKGGSMVVATTRLESVAQSVLATKPYFHLKGMSDESAWLLFKNFAFVEEGNHPSSDLEQLGQQIVRKCANVPLAIVTIASLLRHKDKKHWFPLVNDELSRSAPEGHQKVMHALEISYKELPYPVKRCFGYCSLFPKDYEFEKTRLIHLWIAQGFVDSCVIANKSLEDGGEEYFLLLAERCFFQTFSSPWRTEVTWKMHDLMHDLSKEVTRFESILVDENVHCPWEKTVRHISINSPCESIVDQVYTFPQSKSLRTFLLLNKKYVENSTLNKLISSLRSLRVLDLSASEIVTVPSEIGELIHLRFVDLSWNEMERLPRSICNLRRLQYLDLRRCRSLMELPEDLGNMQSLRHLLLKGCDTLSHMPNGLTALTSLMTLDTLVLHNSNGGLKSLEHLYNLTVSLNIVFPKTKSENETTNVKRSFLPRKSRLHAFTITCGARPDSISSDELNADEIWTNIGLQPPPNLEILSIQNIDGNEIAHWVMGLHNLVVLKLEGCGRCVEIPSLSHLLFLEELHISGMSPAVTSVDNKACEPNVFFASLKTLVIKDMPNLTSWWMQEPTVLPSFPSATRVEIRDCLKLTSRMPLFPLVEDVCLERVQEELIWHSIGPSQGNSMLKNLQIHDVEDLSSVAEVQIRHLCDLRRLEIRGCNQLETMSCNGLAHLTSLTRLSITDCENLQKWDDLCDQKPDLPWIHLQRLTFLAIPNLDRNLVNGFKYLTDLRSLQIECSFDLELSHEEEEEESIPWNHLQRLEELEVAFGETFSMRNNQRLLHGLQHLNSLRYLRLCKCKELYLSWRVLLGLKNLQQMWIKDVEKVVDVDSDETNIIHSQPMISSSIQHIYISDVSSGEWVDNIPWKSLPFLKSLTLRKVRKLVNLPEGIQHLAALQSLQVDGIISLPNWMTSLSSLQSLTLWECSAEVTKRCERLKGEDWPLIQHIPNINIY